MWYLALERLYGPATSLKVSLAKMATDQVFAAPVFTGLFFGVNGLLERKRLEEIGAKLKRDLWSTLKVGKRDSGDVIAP